MRNPLGTCSYHQLYQNVKQFSKNGENFCKELMAVFQQRAELEHTYAKGLQKLAGKLIKASKVMSENSTYNAWRRMSDEMFSRADTHRALGNAFQQDAFLELRQTLDEHSRRKRPLDGIIEKTGKLVTTNWSEQIKMKKKLGGITREHEALFNFVESNKQICTEKEKQKMLNRLTKSAELQVRVDEEYFGINMEGHHMRLKWENTLKHCYQILQELEKERIEVLCNALHTYCLHMSSFGQTLAHGQKQIEQAVQMVDVDSDLQMLAEENSITAEDTKAEFLMVDYFEEDRKSLMDKGRRREAIIVKLQRLQDSIMKTKKECEGTKKLFSAYSGNPSFSNQRNMGEINQQLEESTLKLDLLQATYYKLSMSLSELQGTPKLFHRFGGSITKWKDKDCEHSVLQLSRPLKIRKTPLRSRQSLRASITHKGEPWPHRATQLLPDKRDDIFPSPPSQQKMDTLQTADKGQDADLMVEFSKTGKCKALYDYTSRYEDELTFKIGDLLHIYERKENGWLFGELNGQTGHFPSTYVQELNVQSEIISNNTSTHGGNECVTVCGSDT